MGLSHMSSREDRHAQVFVGDSHGLRRHRHERVAGHTRRGIYFQEPRPALSVEHQVDAPPSRAADEPEGAQGEVLQRLFLLLDRKSTRLNSSHVRISYAVFCLKKKIN